MYEERRTPLRRLLCFIFIQSSFILQRIRVRKKLHITISLSSVSSTSTRPRVCEQGRAKRSIRCKRRDTAHTTAVPQSHQLGNEMNLQRDKTLARRKWDYRTKSFFFLFSIQFSFFFYYSYLFIHRLRLWSALCIRLEDVRRMVVTRKLLCITYTH